MSFLTMEAVLPIPGYHPCMAPPGAMHGSSCPPLPLVYVDRPLDRPREVLSGLCGAAHPIGDHGGSEEGESLGEIILCGGDFTRTFC